MHPFENLPALRAADGCIPWGCRLLIACCLAILPMATPLAADPPAKSSDHGSVGARAPLLKLGVGDAVSIQVYGRPELATTAYISDDGTVPVPLAGPVRVLGQSPSRAAKSIAAAFRNRDLLVDPQVTVFLVESRSQQVSVLGAVAEPGRYVVMSNTTVLDVMAQAGGITEDGGTVVVVMRRGNDGRIKRYSIDIQGLGKRNSSPSLFTLRGGDSVVVPRAERFSIYGEVNQPDIYRLEPGMTVVEAITRAGGITPRGSRNRIEIRRSNADGTFTTRGASLDDVVEPDDVIRIKGRIF